MSIPVMSATMSADNRVVSEEDAAEFLEAFKVALANPAGLIEGGVRG